MPGQQRRQGGKAKAESPGMQIEWGGKTYVLRESDISPRDVRELRRETGFSWVGLSREFARDGDIDLLAALLWLARRLDGDTALSYDEVLDELSYDEVDQLNVSVVDKRKAAAPPAEAENDLPEA